jgi:hypothetical protein
MARTGEDGTKEKKEKQLHACRDSSMTCNLTLAVRGREYDAAMQTERERESGEEGQGTAEGRRRADTAHSFVSAPPFSLRV